MGNAANMIHESTKFLTDRHRECAVKGFEALKNENERSAVAEGPSGNNCTVLQPPLPRSKSTTP